MSNKNCNPEYIYSIKYNPDTNFVDYVRVEAEGSQKVVYSSTLTLLFDKGGVAMEAEIIKRIRITGKFIPVAEPHSSVQRYVDFLKSTEAEDLISKHFTRMTRLLSCLTSAGTAELLCLDSMTPEVIKFKKIRERRINELCIALAKKMLDS